jgi:fluoroacetyl-CoA thioesterase
MRESLQPGITNETRHTVTAAMSAPHLPRVVLATPTMIGLLDDGETTVGTHVCVSHQAAALEGEEITIRCRLKDVNRRRLTFDVEVDTPQARISEGTHERAVVTLSRMA